MQYIPILFLALIAICSLGLSVNMGVAAERMSRLQNKHWQAFAVVGSIFFGAVALAVAYEIGAIGIP